MNFHCLVPIAGRISGRLGNTTRLEVQLAYLVNFAQLFHDLLDILLFLHSKLVLHSSESLFFQEHVHIYLFLFGLVPLAGRM